MDNNVAIYCLALAKLTNALDTEKNTSPLNHPFD